MKKKLSKAEAKNQLTQLLAKQKELEKIIAEKDEDSKSIMDKIKNIDDLFKYLKTTKRKFNLKYKELDKNERAYVLLCLIAKVLNEGWIPNWSDKNEKKWYPWFEFNNGAGAFVYSFTCYVWTDTSAAGGSRLRFKSAELAEFAGSKFVELWNDYLTM